MSTERDSDLKFFGFKGRGCGNHVTDGRDSAWCLDCSEWCYVEGGRCRGCEAVPAKRAAKQFAQMRVERDEALGLLRELVEFLDDPDGTLGRQYELCDRARALVERTNQGGQ